MSEVKELFKPKFTHADDRLRLSEGYRRNGEWFLTSGWESIGSMFYG